MNPIFLKVKSWLEKIPYYNELTLPYHWLQSVLAGIESGFPARHLKVIAVTGTNGKTTTAFMIWQMLRSAGYRVGLMTTVAWGVDKLEPELGHMTTSDAFTLNRRIKQIAARDVDFLVLEITSHALAQFRTFGIPIELAVFTNLTHEHLDYHKTMERYRAAKGKLFKKAKVSVLNADDPATAYYEKLAKRSVTYGINAGTRRAENIELTVSGVSYDIGDLRITTNLPGEFNVYNSLAAAVAGEELHLTGYQIATGIAALKSVEGRMNVINEDQPFTVIVDYAHAPDALEKVFASVDNHTGRIISVHGGAGRRDPSTRPIRGAILADHSDIVIITEDDSRDEDPEAIAEGFMQGAREHGKIEGRDLFKELDRKKAIKMALEMAKKGDLVLILGKGHEKSILRADGPHAFEDIKVTRNLLKKMQAN